MAPETGRKYGPYEVLGRLGGGGMGHVFRAWDARLHREVALKLLHNEYAMPGMRERFLREARAASALNHPNICTIFDIGEQNGDPYLVMELLQGETLRDRIYERPIAVDEVVCIAREIAEALGAAHAKGVVHRDVKPANIFLVAKPNKGVQAKVLDFGLAKIEKGAPGARMSRSLDLTAVGATVGTLAYMSPEQARGESLDSRSDLFSLGVVMYEMATRRIPFHGATSALVFVQLLNHPPEPVRSWNEAVPRELEKIILKLMVKERTARFQTAGELDEALAKLSEKSGGWLRKAVSTVPLVRAPDPVARDRRLPRRRESTSGIDAARDPSTARFGTRSASELGQGPATSSAREPFAPSQMLRPVSRVPSSSRNAYPLGERAEFIAPAADHEAASKLSGAQQAVAQESRSRALPMDSSATSSRALVLRESFGVGEPSTELPGFFEAEETRPKRGLLAGLVRIALALLALLALLAGGARLLHRGPFRQPIVPLGDVVVLTEVENRTGDRIFDGTVAEALQLTLAQSPYLVLRSGDSYRLAWRSLAAEAGGSSGQSLAQHAALRTGAKFYLFGALSGTSFPYQFHVDLLNATSNEVLASVEKQVSTADALPGAIDQLALALRRAAGEGEESIRSDSRPIREEATANLEALYSLRSGEIAFATGNVSEALRLYQATAALDPGFVEVQLRLAVLYRKQHAEVASGDAAKLALAAAEHASERTRTFARYEYEMDWTGDYQRAAAVVRSYLARRPHDASAGEALARTVRLQGRAGEALQLAQQAYTEDPYSSDAYTQAENALIELDRYEAAAQVEAQAQKLGMGVTGAALTTAYLEGREDELEAAIASIQKSGSGYRLTWSYGLYLDNIGQLSAGKTLWGERARLAAAESGLDSAAAFLLAQGALDRALLGDCKGEDALARESGTHPQGLTALFNAGMAEALCGDVAHAEQMIDRLQQRYPQSFAVRGFYLPDLKAALALHDGYPEAALEILRPARQFDLISLTPFLRGQAHVMLHQVQIGIVDFQTVLSHRGLPLIVGNAVYPVAVVGVARAFAATGDLGNSAQAYERFLALWASADPKQPLLTEARAHTH